MNWFILIGIVIIVLGFSLKLDTMAVLIVAALSQPWWLVLTGKRR